jgi:hypothetical protein
MATKRYNAATSSWEAFGSAQINPAALGITPESIGAVNKVNGTVSVAATGSGVVRNIYTSTVAPVTGDGQDGDIWLKYTP